MAVNTTNESESSDQYATKSPENNNGIPASSLTKLRKFFSKKLLAPVTIALALAQADCTDKSTVTPNPVPAASPALTDPSNGNNKGAIVLREIEIIGSPAADEPDPENLDPPKTCQEQTTDTYAKILAGDTGNTYKIPAYFLNPFDCFKDISGPIVPPPEGLFDEGRKVKQEWVNSTRQLLHQQNPDLPYNLAPLHQLPLFFRQSPYSSVDTVLNNTERTIKYNKKNVTLFRAIEGELTSGFKSTRLSQYLRKADFNQAVKEKTLLEKELRDYDKDIAALKRLKKRTTEEQTKLEEMISSRNSTLEMISSAKDVMQNPNTYTDEFLELLLYGLLPQETSYDPASSSGQALGVWQIKPDTCVEVKKKYPGIKCDVKSQHDIKQSTIVAAHYFDMIFDKIQSEVFAFQKDFEIDDPTVILIPAIINSYNSGPDLIKEMLNWFRTNQKETTLELLNKGKLDYEDLYIKVSTEFYRACKQNPNDKENAGKAYGSDSLQYLQKIKGWREIISERSNKNGSEENKPSQEQTAVPATPEPSAKSETIPVKSCGLNPNVSIPETQLNPKTYLTINNSPVGNITITGGFMEPHGHSAKKHTMPAIFADGQLQTFPRGGHRNLGIDYKESRGRIITWYGGEVTSSGLEAGYGNRTVIRTNVSYTYKGHSYPVYQGYAHANSFRPGINPGRKVGQGETIGTMGGTGSGGRRGAYRPHIDCRTYIIVNGETIDLSINALEAQLRNGKR